MSPYRAIIVRLGQSKRSDTVVVAQYRILEVLIIAYTMITGFQSVVAVTTEICSFVVTPDKK